MDKNVLVLSAMSGDQESFGKVYEKLKMYAYSVASELFSDPVIREDAVNQAMDEVADKIRNQRALFENKSWFYVKRCVSNSLIDLARLRDASRSKQETEDSSKCYEKPIDTKELAWIDEGFATITNDGDNDSGFRIFKISEVPQDKALREKESKSHTWIDILEEVLTYRWWGIEHWQDNKSNLEPGGESLTNDEISFIFKYCSEKMWAKWNLINGLLDNITSNKEKHIMLQYLSGFKQSEIAEKHKVSEPYISKILAKYRKDWGWDDNDLQQAKLMLLSKHLSDWYAAPKKILVPSEDESQIIKSELINQLNRARTDYANEFRKLNPGWEIQYKESEEISEETIRNINEADWNIHVRKVGLHTALKMAGITNLMEIRCKYGQNKNPTPKTSSELEAIEVVIEKLQRDRFF